MRTKFTTVAGAVALVTMISANDANAQTASVEQEITVGNATGGNATGGNATNGNQTTTVEGQQYRNSPGFGIAGIGQGMADGCQIADGFTVGGSFVAGFALGWNKTEAAGFGVKDGTSIRRLRQYRDADVSTPEGKKQNEKFLAIWALLNQFERDKMECVMRADEYLENLDNNQKRQLENQIIIAKLNAKAQISVAAIQVNGAVMREIAEHLCAVGVGSNPHPMAVPTKPEHDQCGELLDRSQNQIDVILDVYGIGLPK